MAERRRLLPDTWRPLPGGRAELLAVRCPRCGVLTFPVAAACPGCWNADGLRTEPVAGPGIVYALTVVRVPEPGIEAPYRIGYADFPGGLRVCGRFTGPDASPGDPVEVVAAVLRQHPGGQHPGSQHPGSQHPGGQPPDGGPGPLEGWAFRKAGPSGA